MNFVMGDIMIETVNCPVCNSKIWDDFYTGPFGIEEEHIDCPICGYSYQFCYGSYLLYIGNKTFIWDYRRRLGGPLDKRIKRAHFMAKRNWKKFHKKTTGDKNLPL